MEVTQQLKNTDYKHMRQVLLFLLFTNFCFAQHKSTQETIPNIEIYNAIDAVTPIVNEIALYKTLEDYYSQNVFKNEAHFIKSTKSYFNIALQKNDIEKPIKLFNVLGRYWNALGQYDSTRVYSHKIKTLIPSINDNIILGNYYQLMGIAELDRNLEDSEAFLQKSVSFLQKINDSLSTSWSMSHYSLGVIAERKEDFLKTSNNYNISKKLFLRQQDLRGLGLVKSGIASLYSRNYLFDEAYKERKELIELSINKGNNYDGISIEYMNNALNEKMKGNIDEQRNYLELAEEYAKKSGLTYVRFFSNYNIVIYASQNNEISKALKTFKVLQSLYPKFKGHTYYDILYLEAESYINYIQNNFKEALQLALKKMKAAKNYGEAELILEAHELLSKIYTATGNINNSNIHKTAYANMQSATKQKALENQLIYYQTLYETEKKDLQIKNQKSDIALLDAQNKIKNQWILFGSLGLLLLFGGIILLRSNNFAKKKQKLQELFSQDLINAQEEERTRVARDLHDSVGQQLMLLTRQTKNSGNTTMEVLATNTLAELRNISQGLHPASLERLGFTTAVQDMIDELGEHISIFLSGDIENIDDKINKNIALHLYRIIQEILSNIIKHAQAKAASVTIKTNQKQIHVSLKDNGKGFNYQKQLKTSKSLGMKSLSERCKIIKAKFEVNSNKTIGSEFIITIPYI